MDNEIIKELKPCPRCGNKVLLARGKASSAHTSKIVRLIRKSHGITCCCCGYYKPTVRAWNKRA